MALAQHVCPNEFPPRLDGLWCAIGRTRASAEGHGSPGGSDEDAEVDADAGAVLMLRRAADCLVTARPSLGKQGPDPDHVTDGPLAEQITGCIGLAVAVLGNEEEALAPGEVLAVTQAVTALCSARLLATGPTQ